jgi:ankyrin repeat protein
MKLNISYLKEIGACSEAIKYYKKKYGKEEVDVMTAYNEAEIDWRVWFMGNAELDVVLHLINNGADVNASNNFGSTALILASSRGHTDIVRLLIDHGADVNASNKYGDTALMWASSSRLFDIVRLLLDAGADVNASDSFGETALIWASFYDHYDIVELLRSKGAKG